MSSQSSSMDYIVLLTLAKKIFYRSGGSIFIISGSLVSILNLIIFMRKRLRKYPCSIYFMAFNLSNFLFIILSMLFAVLSAGYDIELSSHNLIFCRLNTYITLLFRILNPFYLILASIDRSLMTSSNALTRRRSTRRLAFTCIIIGTVFWMLFQSHTLVLTNIQQVTPVQFLCYFQPGAYLVFVGYYSLIINGIAISLVLGILGLFILKNVRSLRRIAIGPIPLVNGRSTARGLFSMRSKDRQLIRMLFMDIITYIVFSLMLLIVLIYQQITQYQKKNAQQIQLELIVRQIVALIAYIPFTLGGFTNLFSSKTYRNELKRILLCK